METISCDTCIHLRNNKCRMGRLNDNLNICHFYIRQIIDNKYKFSEEEIEELKKEFECFARGKCAACKNYSMYGKCNKSNVRNYKPSNPNILFRCKDYELNC